MNKVVGDLEFALTLWRPWASVVIHGPKDVENRPWAPPEWILGKRIWIHAGATYDASSHDQIARAWADGPLKPTKADAKIARDTMPAMAIIGSAVVRGWVANDGRLQGIDAHDALRVRLDQFYSGPYAWLLEDKRPLEQPVSCRGLQKLWRPPESVRQSLTTAA